MDIVKYLLILIMIPSTMAITQCGTNYCNDFVIKPGIITDDNTMIINIGATTDKKAYLYKEVDGAITPVTGGGGGGSIITLYYDVLVDVQKEKYLPTEKVTAEIIIINKGHVPDRDGRLSTYIISPNGSRYREKSAEFELIPPTCDSGYDYDWYLDMCFNTNNESMQPLKTIITRELELPENPLYGEWDFVVEYQTRVQPLINVSDSFEVYSGSPFELYFGQDNSWLWLLLICFISYYLTKRKNKRKVKQ